MYKYKKSIGNGVIIAIETGMTENNKLAKVNLTFNNKRHFKEIYLSSNLLQVEVEKISVKISIYQYSEYQFQER